MKQNRGKGRPKDAPDPRQPLEETDARPAMDPAAERARIYARLARDIAAAARLHESCTLAACRRNKGCRNLDGCRAIGGDPVFNVEDAAFCREFGVVLRADKARREAAEAQSAVLPGGSVPRPRR